MDGGTDYVMMQARLQPGRLAARDLTSGRSWTYREFELAVGQFAAGLTADGVLAGERVAALAKNRVELVLLHLACARLGAMFVPLNWRLAGAEIDALIEDAEPKLIFGDALLAERNLPGRSLDDFAARAELCDPAPARAGAGKTPSLILYTSGTSGRPKGVLLSERNIWQTALNFSLLGRVTDSSVVLCDSPMFHVIGLVTNIRPALMRGGAFLVSDGFAPARTLARLGDPALGVTHYFCVPQMAASLRADPDFDPAKLRGLTAIFSGGAPHAPDAIRAWTGDGIAMADGFGMSEAGTVSCMPLDLALIGARAGAAGIVPPGLGIKIVNPRGEACQPGEPGEIFVKGDNVTSGYWRRPAETASAFTEDGWLRSGDIGALDAENYLWLIDRKKDMFISGGENVFPAEIEGALAAYPGLADCAVIGVPDERWGEVGQLFVVPQPGGDIRPGDVLAYLETRLARYKLPKTITLMDALPRNGAGKLVKAQLRAMGDVRGCLETSKAE
jgi:fatty-acyl-CoA synthase